MSDPTDEERADSIIKLHGLPFALAASLGKQEDLKEARAFLYEGIAAALRSARAEGFRAGVAECIKAAEAVVPHHTECSLKVAKALRGVVPPQESA